MTKLTVKETIEFFKKKEKKSTQSQTSSKSSYSRISASVRRRRRNRINHRESSHPSTNLNVNERIFYKYRLIPCYDKNNGHMNLTREAASGAYRFNSKKIPSEIVTYASKASSKVKEILIAENLSSVTENKQLYSWALYNAHMDGPAGDLIANVLTIFLEKNIDLMMMQDDHTYYDIYQEGSSDEIYFKANIAFDRLSINKEQPLKNDDGSPVASYAIIIRARKHKEGIQVDIIAEHFHSYHDLFTKTVNKINEDFSYGDMLVKMISDHEQFAKKNNINGYSLQKLITRTKWACGKLNTNFKQTTEEFIQGMKKLHVKNPKKYSKLEDILVKYDHDNNQPSTNGLDNNVVRGFN